MSARVVAATALAVALSACGRAANAPPDAAAAGGPGASPPAADSAPQPGAWQSLVDGTTADRWRGYKQQTMPSGWSIVDGALTKSDRAEDIVTRDQYGDFELEFDWKLARGGNAGVFYRATEEFDRVYWSGTEYQLLDDANAPDGRSRLTSAGAAYGLYPAPAGVVKPAGEWNTARIVARGPHVEHWLNGQKLLEYEQGGADWEAKVKASKFVEWPKYGRSSRGHIGVQGDHAGELALRNVRVRELR